MAEAPSKEDRILILRNSIGSYRKAVPLFLKAVHEECDDVDYLTLQISYCLKDWGRALISLYRETHNEMYLDRLISFIYDQTYRNSLLDSFADIDEELRDFFEKDCKFVMPEKYDLRKLDSFYQDEEIEKVGEMLSSWFDVTLDKCEAKPVKKGPLSPELESLFNKMEKLIHGNPKIYHYFVENLKKFHKEQKRYVLKASSSKGGKVIGPPKGLKHAYGAPIDLEAKPERCYEFTGWTGSAVDADSVLNPKEAITEVEMLDNYDVKAHFKKTINALKGCHNLKGRKCKDERWIRIIWASVIEWNHDDLNPLNIGWYDVFIKMKDSSWKLLESYEATKANYIRKKHCGENKEYTYRVCARRRGQNEPNSQIACEDVTIGKPCDKCN